MARSKNNRGLARSRYLPNNQAFKVNVCLSILVISQPEISTTTTTTNKKDEELPEFLSLDRVLKDNSKQGIFEADFENENGTTVTVRDGESVILNCRVYLLHDKTVSTIRAAKYAP